MKKQIPTVKNHIDGSVTHDYPFIQTLDSINRVFMLNDYKNEQKAISNQKIALTAQEAITRTVKIIALNYYQLNENICNIFSNNLPDIDFSSTVDNTSRLKLSAAPIMYIINRHEQAKLFLQSHPRILESYKTLAENYVTCIQKLQASLEHIKTSPVDSEEMLKLTSQVIDNFIPTIQHNTNNYLKTLSDTFAIFKTIDNNTELLIEEIVCNNPENTVDVDCQSHLGGNTVAPIDDGV
jgi:hypothetical protein